MMLAQRLPSCLGGPEQGVASLFFDADLRTDIGKLRQCEKGHGQKRRCSILAACLSIAAVWALKLAQHDVA